MDINTTARLLRIALGVLSDRLTTLAALAMTFALSAWAMQEPTWMRMAIAAFFAVCVFIPCIIKERTRHEGQKQPQEQGSP